MMKKRIFSLCIICLLMLTTLTGCSNKKAITTDNFKSIAQSHNYTISDATSQYSFYGYINEATIARKF